MDAIFNSTKNSLSAQKPKGNPISHTTDDLNHDLEADSHFSTIDGKLQFSYPFHQSSSGQNPHSNSIQLNLHMESNRHIHKAIEKCFHYFFPLLKKLEAVSQRGIQGVLLCEEYCDDVLHSLINNRTLAVPIDTYLMLLERLYR
jgi:hypothetical protein